MAYKTISLRLTKTDVKRLDDLKSMLNQKTYSKVVQKLIHHTKI